MVPSMVQARPSAATTLSIAARQAQMGQQPELLAPASTWALKLAAMPNRPMPMATACSQ
jgi:hypothetical protein